MRNAIIDSILSLLVLLLLVPCAVPSAWVKGTASTILPGDGTGGFAENLEPSSQQQICYMTDSSNQPAPTTLLAVPDDNHHNKPWTLFNFQALEARHITSSGKDVLIAILDTGIDQTHKDLYGKVIESMNFSQSPTDSDLHGHGTHIAGIIIAITTNEITGITCNSYILNVKVTDDSDMVCPSTIAKGIVWAADNGANVINMSFTLNKPTQAVKNAVNYAWSQGVVVLSAAGNYRDSKPMYPAYYSNCISVTATDACGSMIPWVNHSDWVDVIAPGINIYSTLPDNSFGYKSGTSMATAYVAGVAGLLFTRAIDVNDNGILNDEVRYMIEHDCADFGITRAVKQ